MIKVFGLNQVKNNIKKFDQKTRTRLHNAMDFTITRAEANAKNNAPWTDRTGNARNSIVGMMLPDKGQVISSALFIGMDYGVFLEMSNEGKYRIVWPTIVESRQELLQIIGSSPEVSF